MKCPKCGNENPEHVVYCGSCGEELSRPANPRMTGIDRSESTLKQESVVEGPEKRERAESSYILAATVSSALALSLLIAGFILRIYLFERWIDLGHSGSS